ncbi:MAG: hypothetical protein ACN6OB_13785 [Chryseobacterium jejuense]
MIQSVTFKNLNWDVAAEMYDQPEPLKIALDKLILFYKENL